MTQPATPRRVHDAHCVGRPIRAVRACSGRRRHRARAIASSQAARQRGDGGDSGRTARRRASLNDSTLRAVDDLPAARPTACRAVVAEQPVDVGGGDLEGRADHPHGRERVGVVVLDVALEQPGQVAPSGCAPKRSNGLVSGRRARWPRSSSRDGRAQRLARQPRPGVEADELRVGRQDVVGERLAPSAEDAAVVLAARARGGRCCGSSAAARPRGRSPRRRTDVLTCSVPVARSRRVGQVPRVELDDHRAAGLRAARRSARGAAGRAASRGCRCRRAPRGPPAAA